MVIDNRKNESAKQDKTKSKKDRPAKVGGLVVWVSARVIVRKLASGAPVPHVLLTTPQGITSITPEETSSAVANGLEIGIVVDADGPLWLTGCDVVADAARAIDPRTFAKLAGNASKSW